MAPSVLSNPSARVARAGVLFGITMLVFVAYALPFFGLLASLSLPFVTHTARRYLWPEAPSGYSIAWSLMAWAGLWLPSMLSIFTPVFGGSGAGGGGLEVSTVWLVVPLCAPVSLNAVLLPALAAAVISLAGLLGAVTTRRGWPWIAAAWLAPWVHQLVFTQIPHQFLC